MKIKLLKKLRKRFIWRYDNDSYSKGWILFDRLKEREVRILEKEGYYVKDAAIEFMLRDVDKSDLFTQRVVIIAERQRRREHAKLVQKWEALNPNKKTNFNEKNIMGYASI